MTCFFLILYYTGQLVVVLGFLIVDKKDKTKSVQKDQIKCELKPTHWLVLLYLHSH